MAATDQDDQMVEITMPRLSDSMETGTIIRWLKREGESVERGEPMVEIETDKATMEVEAPASGLLHPLAAEGDVLDVGAAIGTIAGVAASAPVRAAKRDRDGPRVSPVARRLASKLAIELNQIEGSGPRGRILKADVRAAAAKMAAPAPVEETAIATAGGHAVAAPPTTVRGAAEKVELSRGQSTVALRMSEARATVPDFVLNAEVDMSEVLALRERLGGRSKPPSLNDFIVRATASTLRHHPRVNGSFTEDGFRIWERINIGIAVAAEDALLVPTVFDADRLPLSEIATETRRLAARAREGKLSPQELDGGTFTVSNLGMFGVDRFAGIVNAPQAAILCVGSIADRPVAVGTDIVIRPIANLALVSDHRILYGADSACFLADLVAALENPLSALL